MDWRLINFKTNQPCATHTLPWVTLERISFHGCCRCLVHSKRIYLRSLRPRSIDKSSSAARESERRNYSHDDKTHTETQAALATLHHTYYNSHVLRSAQLSSSLLYYFEWLTTLVYFKISTRTSFLRSGQTSKKFFDRGLKILIWLTVKIWTNYHTCICKTITFIWHMTSTSWNFYTLRTIPINLSFFSCIVI